VLNFMSYNNNNSRIVNQSMDICLMHVTGLFYINCMHSKTISSAATIIITISNMNYVFVDAAARK